MLNDKDSLKEKLKIIKNNNYEITSDINYYQLTIEMLEYIGSPDSEFRDELIYSILSNWIIKEVFTPEQIREVLKICLDDQHLFYKVGEIESDSVFTRSFSVLLIPPILITHRKNNILSKSEVLNLFNKIIQYVREEKDLRGYIKNNGWAHSVAHSADALDEFAMCRYIGHDELLEMLKIIKFKVSERQYAYVYEEDERMVTAVVNIIERRELKESEIIDWLEGFKVLEKSKAFIGDDYLNFNVKNFLRSLYFRLLDEKDLAIINNSVKNTLDSISNFK